MRDSNPTGAQTVNRNVNSHFHSRNWPLRGRNVNGKRESTFPFTNLGSALTRAANGNGNSRFHSQIGPARIRPVNAIVDWQSRAQI